MRKFLFILIIGIFVLNSSFNTIYPEPLYYTVYETDNVIIKYSREVYNDIYGVREETTKSINKRFDGLTKEEIEYNAILTARSKASKKIKDYAQQTIN